VIDIICTGGVLPLECVAPAFDRKDFKSDLVPEDGQIIRDRTYDELKRERLKESLT
jgi:hypothetical protein